MAKQIYVKWIIPDLPKNTTEFNASLILKSDDAGSGLTVKNTKDGYEVTLEIPITDTTTLIPNPIEINGIKYLATISGIMDVSEKRLS